MAFQPFAATSNSPFTAYSTPYRISFTAFDEGTGASLLVNANGANGAIGGNTYLDMRTFFGTAFNARFLSTLFQRKLAVLNNDAATNLLIPNLDIQVLPLGPFPTDFLIPTPLGLSGLPGVPDGLYLQFQAPAIATTWRIDIALRHSILF